MTDTGHRELLENGQLKLRKEWRLAMGRAIGE